MKLFITGASGFVGGAVARYFVRQGHNVVAMSRSEKSDEKIKELGAQPVRASLGSVSLEALKGVEVIVHAAAYVEEWGSYDDFYQPNVVGTEQLLAVAQQAGVAQFIFLGSEALLFTGKDLLNVDETYPYPQNPPFYYSKTKQLAEKSVLSANHAGFRTVSVRPRLVWGPGDQSVLPAVKRLFEAGSFSWIGGGQYRTSSTHIDNLVHGIELAIERGKGGNAYFILDEGVRTMREFLTRYLATAGVELKGNSIPKGVVRTLATVVEGSWRLFGIRKQPPITRFAANVMSAHCVLNDDKARRELGYRPVVSFEEGLARL
jgi:nucleoside-diphosphate-sugar epimerase